VPLLTRTVNTPFVVEIARGSIGRLGSILAENRIAPTGNVVVVLGPGIGDRLAPLVEHALPNATVVRADAATVDEARRVEGQLRGRTIEAAVAIGGGGTLDVTKYAASAIGLPFVAVATNLAHDGIASPVAVLEHDGHRVSFGVHIPFAIVVDLDWATECPVEHVRSGIGDVVSNIGAVEDWLLARDTRGERADGLAIALAQTPAEAVLRHPGSTSSLAFVETLAHSLVLSGVAMSVAGTSRPCSGACHEVSHAIDLLFPGSALHGQQVGVGALFAAHLRDSPTFGEIDACFRRHGVARTPADLGLSAAQFTEAVLAAPATRPDRYTILEHLALTAEDARKRVDAFIESLGR
jgi:glycerol-1-phosphate dehydrogenase [NAD(P)+]